MAEVMPVRGARSIAAIVAGICLGAAAMACAGSNAASPSPTPRDEASAVASAAPPASATVPASATAASRPDVTVPTPAPTQAASGSAGEPIAFSTGSHLLPSDLAARGVGEAGRGPFTGERLIIPSIRVDAPLVAVKVVDGSMPPSPSPTDVAWYDFAGLPSLGGSPGNGGNVVLAGDAGRMGYGPGVFWSLVRVKVGDYVKILLSGGETVCYGVEFNKLAVNSEVDFGEVVRATPAESVTLITAGVDANSRTVVWGRRASCADAPTATPTPAPPAGHFRVKIVAENYQFTVVEGATIPKGFSSIDVTLELRDTGVKHGFELFAPAGWPVNHIDPVEGPATVGTTFLVGLPELAGRYTFQCPVHPQMTGSITVESP